jgi:hypothetical protein
LILLVVLTVRYPVGICEYRVWIGSQHRAVFHHPAWPTLPSNNTNSKKSQDGILSISCEIPIFQWINVHHILRSLWNQHLPISDTWCLCSWSNCHGLHGRDGMKGILDMAASIVLSIYPYVLSICSMLCSPTFKLFYKP